MQQRQLRLGDILDDYCPRERRLTNHAVVAMVGDEVKQTRCTTCDTEHEFKHAKVPRHRKKSETAVLHPPASPAGPKRVEHEHPETALEPPVEAAPAETPELPAASVPPENVLSGERSEGDVESEDGGESEGVIEEGPVHRPLIRATLPRPEGQAPPARPVPEFTIRQPGGRPNRFRPRHMRGTPFVGNRPNGQPGGSMRGGASRPGGGGRPPHAAPGPGRRHGHRKRSK